LEEKKTTLRGSEIDSLGRIGSGEAKVPRTHFGWDRKPDMKTEKRAGVLFVTSQKRVIICFPITAMEEGRKKPHYVVMVRGNRRS